MKIRTYYWHDRVVGRLGLMLVRAAGRDPAHYFRIGNSGDIFAADVIRNEYSATPVNAGPGAPRLLLVGSIGHRVTSADVVCGIGVKTPDLPVVQGRGPLVLGVRGPISFDVMKRAGYDLSHVSFQLDPGLLIRYYIPQSELSSVTPCRVGFIPHYRERGCYSKMDLGDVQMINIDATPDEVAGEILKCELVYSSSLHGIIFSHSLGRPCVFVRPKTEEPMLKFQDYFSSVGIPFPDPLDDICERRFIKKPTSPVTISFDRSDFDFPSKEVLVEHSIAW